MSGRELPAALSGFLELSVSRRGQCARDLSGRTVCRGPRPSAHRSERAERREGGLERRGRRLGQLHLHGGLRRTDAGNSCRRLTTARLPAYDHALLKGARGTGIERRPRVPGRAGLEGGAGGWWRRPGCRRAPSCWNPRRRFLRKTAPNCLEGCLLFLCDTKHMSHLRQRDQTWGAGRNREPMSWSRWGDHVGRAAHGRKRDSWMIAHPHSALCAAGPYLSASVLMAPAIPGMSSAAPLQLSLEVCTYEVVGAAIAD